MAKRRANGEGHLYKKKNGRWAGMVTKGYDSLGKQKFKYFSGKTKQDVIALIQEYKNEVAKGEYLESNSWTVSSWLDHWYETHSVNKVKTTTRVNDEAIIKNHLKPNLGKLKFSELKGHQIQKMYNDMLKKGKVNGKKGGLSPKTIRNIHVVLHRALEQARKEELIIKNPLVSVTLPRIDKAQIEILSPEEQKALAKNCYEHPWGMSILLTLYSGMRMGEVLGLTWKDVSFERNTISINKQLSRLKDYGDEATAKTKLYLRQETKTRSSTRMIYIAPAVMAKLKEHQERQEKLRKKFGKAYMNLGMVFCREDGWYIDPKTFRDFYLRTLDKAGVDHKTFHALRHTFATRALESNANIKVVSEILGHASIQITLDTYSHVSTELQRDTMQMIADNFFIEKETAIVY